MSKNVSIVIGALVFIWCVLIIRLFSLQIVQYDYYKAKVLSNVQKTTTTKAVRGVIYDSEMNKLAANYTVYRIFISPHDIEEKDEETIARGLSDILGVDYAKTLAQTKKKVRWDETVLKKATEEQAEAVRKFKTENGFKTQIYLEANQTRYYPYGSLSSHVIGVVGTDKGLTGLEYQYDSYLTGESGKIIISKDAAGNQIYSEYDTYLDVSNGANLVTTLNPSISKALLTQLMATYNDSSPLDRVTGIVMDVKTGAVLAMETYPNFDLNDPFVLDEKSLQALRESGIEPGTDEYVQKQTDLLYNLWRNKAVTEPYEPGSTFKIITTASAIEEGTVTFDTEFECTGSYKGMYCHKHRGHGLNPFRVGLQQSCNPTLMQVAESLGRDRFWDYLIAFGYKEKTGIDLPDEASSITHSKNAFVDNNMLA
ncbi:MAG: penicillin-binding protein 2, partial [Firmicutes bacterium]|nr:penicillin-binding protein 2 [Candidatus Colimorpha enterica]